MFSVSGLVGSVAIASPKPGKFNKKCKARRWRGDCLLEAKLPFPLLRVDVPDLGFCLFCIALDLSARLQMKVIEKFDTLSILDYGDKETPSLFSGNIKI